MIGNNAAWDTATTDPANRATQAVSLNVAGVAVSGGTYAITGTGFGALDQTAQMFDDFELEDIGAIQDFKSELVRNNKYAGLNITDSKFVSGTRCISNDYSLGDFPELYVPLSGLTKRAYLSCHIFIDGSFDYTGTGGRPVWKFARIGAGSVYSGKPKASAEYTNTSNAHLITTPEVLSGTISPVDGGLTYAIHDQANADIASVITSGEWHFYECEFYSGTTDQMDCYFLERWDGIETITYVDRNFLSAADSSLPTWFLTPLNGLGDYFPFTLYMDNLHVNESGARVVMTDSPVYANSTKWAGQPINNYTSGSVTVTSKRQGFSVGGSAYLHLFNAVGVLVSEGNAIEVQEDAA